MGVGGLVDLPCGPTMPSRCEDILRGYAKVKALEMAKMNSSTKSEC